MSLQGDHFIRKQSEVVSSVFLGMTDGRSNYSLNILCGSDEVFDFLRGFGKLFYVVSPSETTYRDPKDVPLYFEEVSLINIHLLFNICAIHI